MKIRTIAALAAAGMLAAHAMAQSTAPAAGGGSTPAAQEAQRTAATSDRPVEGANDPRRCLEFSTNLEVHTCAEKYRPRKRST